MGIKITPADSAFSKCVRERAEWTCERCKKQHHEKSMGLHCAHFMSRGHWATRFHPQNAAALCYGCHSHLDSHPDEKKAFFTNLYGEEVVNEIRTLAYQPAHGLKKKKKFVARFYRVQHESQVTQRQEGVTGYLPFERYTHDLPRVRFGKQGCVNDRP